MRDFGVGGDGVDGDQRAFQPAVFGEPVDQNGDRGKLVGFAFDRFLTEHESARGGESRDQMQRSFVGGAIMAAARGLAVDGD